jgi:hypothetical protein
MDARHWNTHRKLYLAGCEHEKVEPNKRVMMAVTEEVEGTKLQEQRTLEGWTVAKVPSVDEGGVDGAHC